MFWIHVARNPFNIKYVWNIRLGGLLITQYRINVGDFINSTQGLGTKEKHHLNDHREHIWEID
jgi:hypothetical protein